jgi:glycine/D-amino acid oxidase-like deaminating enzyme
MREKDLYDVVIAGGGIMGCSTAYNLIVRDSSLKIAVVEKDPTYSYASTSLSLANIRVQFSLKENILISKYGLEKLAVFAEEMRIDDYIPDINFHREGNLFMVDKSGQKEALDSLAKQKELSCEVEWWTPETIRKNYPLYEPLPYPGGTFGRGDGYFDAHILLQGFKRKSKKLGVDFIHDEVIKIKGAKGRVSGAVLNSGRTLRTEILVNCTGAWASQLLKTADILIPVFPVKRQVFVLEPEVKPPTPLPLTILPSGLYFRSETGNLVLCGKSMVDDPNGIDFTWNQQRFRDILWPELAEFVPAFDRLKIQRGWAGLYAVNTFDGNALIGEWPELKGLFLANGFSGHGLQQSPAAGRYLAEIITGSACSLDLSLFHPKRILEGRPLTETGLV